MMASLETIVLAHRYRRPGRARTGGDLQRVVVRRPRCECHFGSHLLRRHARCHVGVSSAGLHMPGAASFAKTASRVARASGVRYPLIGRHAVEILFTDSDAASLAPVEVAEVAVGVEAVSELVGQLGQLIGTVLARPGGPAALRPCTRVSMSTKSGMPMPEAADHRDVTGTEIAGALRGSGGLQHRRSKGSPLEPCRSPRSAASWTRRDASARLIRNRSAIADGSLPPSIRVGSTRAELVDQRVLDGRAEIGENSRIAAAPPTAPGVVNSVERQIQGTFVAGLKRVETPRRPPHDY